MNKLFFGLYVDGSIKEGLYPQSQFKRQIVKSSGLSSQKSGKTKQKVIAK